MSSLCEDGKRNADLKRVGHAVTGDPQAAEEVVGADKRAQLGYTIWGNYLALDTSPNCFGL